MNLVAMHNDNRTMIHDARCHNAKRKNSTAKPIWPGVDKVMARILAKRLDYHICRMCKPL